MLKSAGKIFAGLFLLTSMALAQAGRSEISLGVTGDFGKETDGNDVVQTSSNSAGLLATFRFSITPKNAAEINYGLTRNTQYYSVTNGYTGYQYFYAIQADIDEATVDYVFRPLKVGRLSPFVLAGGGALIFVPTGYSYGTNTEVKQTKGAFLYGGGTDFRVARNIAVRLQYRGLIYRAPDFAVSGITAGASGHIAEPSLALVFHF
jgi:opacity protein-like surface antigen